MEELCDQIVDMATEDVFAAYISFQGHFLPNNCSLAFHAGIWNESGWDSVSLYFKEFEIHDDSCLVITSLTNWTTEFLGRYCQYDNLTHVVFNATNGGMLHLQYEDNRHYSEQGSLTVIELVVTVFVDNGGNCSTYVCDTNRCIPNELICRGFNPCGDWSDCPIDEALAVAIAVTFTAFLFVLICVICKCCCCYNSKTKASEGVVLSRPRATTRFAEPQVMRYSHNELRTAESIEIFPDTWDNNSLNEEICLEPYYNRQVHSMRNLAGGPNEKRRFIEICQRNPMSLTSGVTNGYDGACGSSVHEAYGMNETVVFRAETPPPSYEEVIADTKHLESMNRPSADGQ